MQQGYEELTPRQVTDDELATVLMDDQVVLVMRRMFIMMGIQGERFAWPEDSVLYLEVVSSFTT